MIYRNRYDDSGNERSDCTLIFIEANKEGDITSVTNGGKVVGISSTGLAFVVDKLVADQIDKFKINGRDLELIEGETLNEPVKTEKELQIEAIERELAALKAEPEVPKDIGSTVEETTDIGGQAEDIFNEYDEITWKGASG